MGKLNMATTKKRNAVVAWIKPALERPFDRDILVEAERIAAEYQVALRFDKEAGWCGRCVELPLVVGFGRDPNACVRETRELVATTVAVMLENKEKLPPPVSEEVRSEQINVRLTPSERYRLEDSARRGGFRGVSDYVRAAALK